MRVETITAGYLVGGRYELQHRIATGGMATVWEARDQVLDRRVALKMPHAHLAADEAFLRRFRREAVAAAGLSHSSIVSIYDTVSNGPVKAIVMELIEGLTLRAVLDAQGSLSSSMVIVIATQVADALDEAHRGGVVHRDIKPSNILLCPDQRVMVTDFGISKAGEDTDLTATGAVLGTAKYLSPEQVEGSDVDPRSDLYSLGVVMYEALSGSAPFEAENDAATALARLKAEAPPLDCTTGAIDPQLASTVHRLLARDREDRFNTARDFGTALSGLSTRSRPRSVPGNSASDATAPLNSMQSDAVDPTAVSPVEPTRIQREELDDDLDVTTSNRSWFTLAFLTVFLGGALVLAAALLIRSNVISSPPNAGLSNQSGSGRVATTMLTNMEDVVPPQISGIATVDPQGDGSENDDLLALAHDGDLATAWRTDGYDRPGFAGLKDGLGVVLDLGGNARVERVEIFSPSVGWTIEVFVGSDFSGPRSSWGEPTAVAEYSGDDATEVLFSPATGTSLMLWITDPGVSPVNEGSSPKPDRFELSEISIS